MSTQTETDAAIDIDRSTGDFHYDVQYKNDAGRGINEETLEYISNVKGEDDWILDFRKRALKIFNEKPMPTHWASEDLKAINFDEIRYYLSGGTTPARSWDDVPQEMKDTFERLGIPEEEVRQKYVDQVPMKRGCSYEDVANALVFLCSDDSSYMTGQAINVTGGQQLY